MINKLITIIATLSAILPLFMLSACKTSSDEQEELIYAIGYELAPMYNSVPAQYSDLDEYKKRTTDIWKEDRTNEILRTVLGNDIKVSEFRLSNGQIFAVYYTYPVYEDPIPEIEFSDVDKIIYGHSLDEGLVVEDSDALRSIISCLKTKTLKPLEEAIVILRVENDNFTTVLTRNTVSLHGCTMALRIVLKSGEVVCTGGHVENSDWNPELADVFTEIIEDGEVSSLGDKNIEELLQSDH